MSKVRRKQRKSSLRKGWRASRQQVEAWLVKAAGQFMEGKYRGTIQTARRILRHVPKDSRAASEALSIIGNALGMLQDFEGSYEALSKALEIQPEDAETLHSRALASRIQLRTGESVRDLERAVELEADPRLRRTYEEALADTSKVVQEQLALRGPGFTLDQLIEQQQTFWRGIKLMEAEQWEEAEATFRRVIGMSACTPPQPWGNLASCLIMQERYDEAKEALHRALEIQPDYEIALQNLLLLPLIRQQGPSAMSIRAPHEGYEIKQSITFVTD